MPEEVTEAELWAQVREGNSARAGEAFGELFERHSQAVFAYCLRRTGIWAVAEDLVSVVFMETWRKRTAITYEGSGSPQSVSPQSVSPQTVSAQSGSAQSGSAQSGSAQSGSGWTLLPWLYGVALGVTRNHHRSRSRYKAALGKVPHPAADDDHAEDVARRVDAEIRTRSVIAELAKLPVQDREVLEMSAWSDLSHAQIAQVLGIPIGTVKSRLARAQRTLRGAPSLKEHCEEAL